MNELGEHACLTTKTKLMTATRQDGAQWTIRSYQRCGKDVASVIAQEKKKEGQKFYK